MKTTLQLQAAFAPTGDQPNAIQALIQGVNHGLTHQVLLGVTGSGKTFTIANVINTLQRPTLIMAPNKTLAAQLYGEFKAFFPKNAVEYFVSYYDYYQPEAYVPASDTFIEKDASINAHIEQMRLSATKALLERNDAIIIATVSAIYGLGDPKLYLDMVLHVSRNEHCKQKTIIDRLIAMQYNRTMMALERGQFRAHGDTIDIFPADSEKDAIRIILFDDTIESIYKFDPLTGSIFQQLPRTTIFPKTHYVTPRSRILETIEQIKDELQQRIAYFNQHNKLIESQRLAQRTAYDIEMMLELGYCNGIENYSCYLSGNTIGNPPPTLFNYLPKNAILIIDESHVTIPQIGAMFKGDRSRKENLVNYGFRLPSALDNRPLRFEEFEALAPQIIHISATPGRYELEHASQIVEQVIRPTGLIDPEITIRPAKNQVEDLTAEIHAIILKKQRILVTTLTKRMAEDLTTYLHEQNIKVRYLHADIDTIERVEIIRDLRLGKFDVLVGINLLREGLDIPEVALVAILDADKEGFLRSERSLIQTVGRAARHIHGRAILYADKITNSMQCAIDETNRRRNKQEAYNIAHNITPQGIQKSIEDILEGAYTVPIKAKQDNLNQHIQLLSTEQIYKNIKKLEKQMKTHAKKMEFELAAQCRDTIINLWQQIDTL